MLDLSKVNILHELDSIGWTYTPASENQVKCLCPFHEDSSPSCSVNIKEAVFKCFTSGCEMSGDILTLLAKILKTTRAVIYEDLCVRYDVDVAKTIDPTVVERYHQEIWKSGPFLTELHKRGITDNLIRQYRIGFTQGRITIPITNMNGLFVNIRRYLPGAPGVAKMRNTRGHGSNRLFPPEQLKFDKIVICGGELKAILTASLLNESQIGAISTTAGEGNWEPSFNPLFKDKDVYLCYDIDDEGVKGADRICTILCKLVKSIRILSLPLDKDKYPHGDINDWVGQEGATSKNILELIDNTTEWFPPPSVNVMEDVEPISLHLSESVAPVNVTRRVKVLGTVVAVDKSPYIAPKRVMVNCERNQPNCSVCPIFAIQQDENRRTFADIHHESPGLLEMVATPKKSQREAIMTGLGIPACKTVTFSPTEFYNIEDIRVTPQLEITERQVQSLMLPAYGVNTKLELNESYEFIGRAYPHPKSQQSILLTAKATPVKDALSSYSPSQHDLENLEIFQPEQWTADAIREKLDLIYEDLSLNVTRIFHRQLIHLTVDLAYHSVLLLQFEQQIVRGWVEVLVVGDSSQGKSEVTLRLKDHYQLGTKVECKNATIAGLLGGCQQLGGEKWFITWGIIPTQDKRLVILEELKGASTDVISRLTDMRSSGIAEIPKIEKRRTHARTRIIALSNPRSTMPMAAYNFGVDCIKELIGGLEDIRRFDMHLIVTSGEVRQDDITASIHKSKPTHIYTSDLCKQCILWAWTRSHEQVFISQTLMDYILVKAKQLCEMFTESIPIIDSGSIRLKIIRLSTALAARTFSHEDLSILIVRDCHVDVICDLLIAIYSSRQFGYKDYSDAIVIMNQLSDEDAILQKLKQVPFPLDFVKNILHTTDIELRDICDWCGWDRDNSSDMLSFLVRKHALRRDGRAYKKTPDFIKLLKGLKVHDRPEFIKEPI